MPRDPVWGWVKADEHGWRNLHVIGTRSYNADERQAEIKRMKLGEVVHLRRGPRSRTYPNNVLVFSQRGIEVGYLKEKNAELLAPAMDQGLKFIALTVSEADAEAYLVGLWIKVRARTI